MTYYDPTIEQGAATAASVPARPCPNLSPRPPAPIAAPVSEEAAPDGELPKGTWFDEAYDFRDPEGGVLTEIVLSCIAAIDTRQRKPRRKDAENRYVITRRIVANALRCHSHRDPPVVAYASKADLPYYISTPGWLSGGAMKRTIKLLEKAGLVTLTTGRRWQASSTYTATPALLKIAARHGITANSLIAHRLRPERLVRLYEQKSGNSSLVAFAPTEETGYWTALLTEYNAFIAKRHIDLALTAGEEQQWVARWNEKREGEGHPAAIRPELIQTDLHRSFNNGWNESFMEGGRLYGGWWINTPGHLRKKITINGQPVIEADYSGCQIRMLYHERSIDYRDDPYELEALIAYARASGLPDDHYREAVKAMMQALINGRSDRKLELAPLKSGFSYDPFEPLAVRRMIEEKHADIADVFGTGEGLCLQRRDSDLALTIIVNLMRQGIVALSVHDSFIVAEKYREILIEEMKRAYRNMFKGYEPIINIKGLMLN